MIIQPPAFKALIDAYPLQGTLPAKLRYLVHFAILAPSNHNAQPWLFKVADDTLELHADRSRALPVVDPDDRELVISCGAALYYLQLAARQFGFAAQTKLLPDASQVDLLARLSFNETVNDELGADDPAQFNAIPKRHTFRYAFEPLELPAECLAKLRRVAETQGVWLSLLTARGKRRALAALIAKADQLQWKDPDFRRELAHWLRPNRRGAKDGIPGYALGQNAVTAALSPLVVRTFDMDDGRAVTDTDLALASPALAVIGTAKDSVSAQLRTGQALAALLLQARAEGVFASFLNQPLELPLLRPRVAQVVQRSGQPQLILRLGYGYDIPATPRRALNEVML